MKKIPGKVINQSITQIRIMNLNRIKKNVS